MIKKKYQLQIKQIVTKHCPKNARIFIFGSCVRSDDFNDVDVGVDQCKFNGKSLMEAREELEESSLPYNVDLVDFTGANKAFKNEVFKAKILWLT